MGVVLFMDFANVDWYRFWLELKGWDKIKTYSAITDKGG